MFKSPFIAKYPLQKSCITAAGLVIQPLVGTHHLAYVGLLHQGFEGGHVRFPEVAGINAVEIEFVAAPFRAGVNRIVLGTGQELPVLRVFGSLQMNLPLPLGPNWGASAFVDAGRVWAPAGFVFNLADTLAVTFPNLAPVLDRLRQDGRYAKMQAATRARDLALQGSLNPNLADFGTAPETRQYSGREVEAGWTCPFHVRKPR